MPACNSLFWPPLGIKVPREFGRTPAGRARLCGEAWVLQWLGWWHQQALRESIESDVMGGHGPSTTQVAFLARPQLPWEGGSVRESRVLSKAQFCPWLCSQQTKSLGSWLASGRGVACCVAEPVSLLPQREEEPPGAKAAPTEWIIACMEGCGDSRLSPPLGMGHRS